MHSTGQPVSQSIVGMLYILQLFSLASYFLHTECRHLSVHHGRRPFGVLNLVLVQNLSRFCLKKRTKKHRQKRHKNLFYSKTPSYKKNIKTAWPKNCVKRPRDFHHKMSTLQTTSFNFAQTSEI